MSFSPLIDQRPLIPSGSSDCGEACVAMVLQHLGHDVSVQQVLALHSSFTDISEIQALLIHFGIKGTSIIGGGFDNNDKLVIALFHDDNYANPSSTGKNSHYGVVYDQPNNNSVQMANPWGARDINYPDSQFNPAYIAAVVVPIAANTVAPLIGEVMTPQQATAVGEALFALAGYEDLLDRNDETTASVSGWGSTLGAAILSGDINAVRTVVNQFIGATETVSKIAQRDAALTGFAPLKAQVAGLVASRGLTAAQVQQIAHDEVVKALKAGEAGA